MLTVLGSIGAVLLGLLAGFLVNVIATRLAGGRPLLGPLHCSRAPHVLLAWQVVPLVGYAAQRGTCSICGKRISPAYPLTEAGTAALFLGLFAIEGPGISFAFHCAYVAVLMLVLVMDWRHRDIYLSVIGVGCVLAIVGSLVIPGMSLVSAVIGAAVAGGFFLVAYLVAQLVFRHIQEPLGLGDVFLALLMGLMLGFPNIVGALIVGPLIAGAVAGVLLLTKRSSMGDFMPYGVSLCVAAIIFLLNPVPLAQALHLPALLTVLTDLIGHTN